MAVTAVVVAIATVMASGILKDATMRSVDALCESPGIGGLIIALFGCLKSDLRLLKLEVVNLQALLRADRLKPARCSNTATNVLVLAWLTTVEDASYYADNVLDEMSYRVIRLVVENRINGRSCFLHKLASDLAFHLRISCKVKKSLSMIRKISDEAAKNGIKPAKYVANERVYQPAPAMSGDLEDVRACVVASDMVGRTQDKELIVNKLCCAQDDQRLSVVAIVGMSGMGKTTLARRAYYDERVVTHFPQKKWISVSDNFSLMRTLKEMADYSKEFPNRDEMEEKLRKYLEEKRYLLVLDDVWHVNPEAWNNMKELLESVGGSVLVTTQNDEVVSVMNASYAHAIGPLCESDSWMLFKREAFANKSPEQKSNLEAVGKRIVSKCNGVPLAIKAIGSTLKSNDEMLVWEKIESSEVWGSDLGDTRGMVMPSLLVSFNNLRSESARQCFIYCSVILPKGFSATEMTLVELWMAHGFLQESELQTMEDHGKEILQVLLHRYLLQVDKYDVSGEVITYRMHDLMQNLALYISRGKCLVVKSLDELKEDSAVKHLRLLEKNTHDHTDKSRLPKLELRSLFSLSGMPSSGNGFKYLRVLSLTGGLTEVPARIGTLKHLRYLDLSRNLFEVLPDSLGDLYHLQTLKLEHCSSLIKLPDHINRLINLRHLSTTKHVVLPVGFGQLTNLQELPMLNLQAEGWKVDELGTLLNIGGVLSIKGVEHIISEEEARRSKLSLMPKISKLELIWNRERSDEGECGNELAVMEGLQPDSNLKSLLVKNYNGQRFPAWIPTFPSLRSVSLLNCKGCEHLPTLGHLPSLQILRISGMTSLEEVGFGFYHNDEGDSRAESKRRCRIVFPKLKELTFVKMRSLRHWSGPPTDSAMSAFPCLEVLEIKECPKLVTVPTHFPSLQKLSFHGVERGKPLEMILSRRSKLSSLTSLAVHNVELLPSLSKELLHCTSLQQIQVSSCKELTGFPRTLQSLLSLEDFQVEDCDSLEYVPDITGLISLTRLVVRKCKNLKHPPMGLSTCTSIETLALSGCPKFVNFPDLASLSSLKKLVLRTFSNETEIPNWLSGMSNLRSLDIGDLDKELDTFPVIRCLPASLRGLYIVGWPKLQSLPSQLCKFTQLERLGLFRFNGVETLPEWLCELSSLQILWIWECNNIKFLPQKEKMQRLNRLRLLNIISCPLLKERCSMDGAEWDKILHIPRILIDDEDIQTPI